MQKLTTKQRTILLFIAEHIDQHGFPPTIRELGEGIGIRSTNGVNDHLKALEKKEYIVRSATKSRAITLTPTGLAETGADLERIREATQQPARPTTDASHASTAARQAPAPIIPLQRVPLLGAIAAGLPIEAIESVEDTISIDPQILGRYDIADVFALKIQGESMIEDGILDGDIVFIRRQATGSRGETLAVMVNGEATLKRYHPHGDRIVLEPANASMAPIIIRKDAAADIRILGKAIGLYRRIGF